MSLEQPSTLNQLADSYEPKVGQRIVETTVAFVSFLPGVGSNGKGESFIRTADKIELHVPGEIILSEGDKIRYLDTALSTETYLGKTTLRYSYLDAASTSE